MSCTWCQDMHVPLPQPPPPPPPTITTTTTSLHKLLTNRVSAGWNRGFRQRGEEETTGVLQFSTSVALMPDTVGLTRGCMPYQDPVYSQPGTHFHNVACGLLRKRIPPRQRSTVMLTVLCFFFPLLLPICFLLQSYLSLFSLCSWPCSLCALFDLFPS